MNAVELITRKRDGHELSDAEIEAFIDGYTAEEIPDYQMSALAMAILFRGMSDSEIVTLTRCMAESGDRIEWLQGTPLVDKHSTGGIGDKVSLPLAPLLACCGVRVPMISGRGLGATGGTLDKLDSIPGFRTDLSLNEFRSVVNWNGCGITGATENLAPADRRLYALRDVTGTIPSIPLITGSILSKKIAEGIDTLVLDVKWGTGAFMKSLEEAQKLARTLVQVGSKLGLQVSALITDMNQPLGYKIGNSLEVQESLDILDGNGPDDVMDLTLQLGSRLLVDSGVAEGDAEARDKMQHAITHKMASEKFAEMVDSQGGKLKKMKKPEFPHVVKSTSDGFVKSIQADRLGLAVVEMGGGRKKLGDQLKYGVGIELHKKVGDPVEIGQPLATVHCDSDVWKYATELVAASFSFDSVAPRIPELVVDTIVCS